MGGEMYMSAAWLMWTLSAILFQFFIFSLILEPYASCWYFCIFEKKIHFWHNRMVKKSKKMQKSPDQCICVIYNFVNCAGEKNFIRQASFFYLQCHKEKFSWIFLTTLNKINYFLKDALWET